VKEGTAGGAGARADVRQIPRRRHPGGCGCRAEGVRTGGGWGWRLPNPTRHHQRVRKNTPHSKQKVESDPIPRVPPRHARASPSPRGTRRRTWKAAPSGPSVRTSTPTTRTASARGPAPGAHHRRIDGGCVRTYGSGGAGAGALSGSFTLLHQHHRRTPVRYLGPWFWTPEGRTLIRDPPKLPKLKWF